MRITPTQVLFWRTKDIYSQWNPTGFRDGDLSFCCAEQYMMYQKAMLFGDTVVAARILAETDPWELKSLGRQVKGFVEEIWKVRRLDIIVRGNYLKFTQNTGPRDTLLATEDRQIVEASPDDCIYGVGLEENDPRVEDPAQWQGLNLLGEALMIVRTLIRYGALIRI